MCSTETSWAWEVFPRCCPTAGDSAVGSDHPLMLCGVRAPYIRGNHCHGKIPLAIVCSEPDLLCCHPVCSIPSHNPASAMSAAIMQLPKNLSPVKLVSKGELGMQAHLAWAAMRPGIVRNLNARVCSSACAASLHVSRPTNWLESKMHFSFAEYLDRARHVGAGGVVDAASCSGHLPPYF